MGKRKGQTVATSLLTDTPTLAEIDEALSHAQAIPSDERGSAWHAYTDRLLELRRFIENTGDTLTETY